MNALYHYYTPVALSIKPKFPVQPVEMECAVQTEISRDKRTTFTGNPLFPFQPVGTEIPFAQNLHFNCLRICSCLHQAGLHQLLSPPSRSTKEIASFSSAWKRPSFWRTRKISGTENFGSMESSPGTRLRATIISPRANYLTS